MSALHSEGSEERLARCHLTTDPSLSDVQLMQLKQPCKAVLVPRVEGSGADPNPYVYALICV